MTLREDVDVQQNVPCGSPYNSGSVDSPIRMFPNVSTFPGFTKYD